MAEVGKLLNVPTRAQRGPLRDIAQRDFADNEQGSGHNREEAVPPLPNYFFFAFTFPRGLALAATRRASLSMWV